MGTAIEETRGYQLMAFWKERLAAGEYTLEQAWPVAPDGNALPLPEGFPAGTYSNYAIYMKKIGVVESLGYGTNRIRITRKLIDTPTADLYAEFQVVTAAAYSRTQKTQKAGNNGAQMHVESRGRSEPEPEDATLVEVSLDDILDQFQPQEEGNLLYSLMTRMISRAPAMEAENVKLRQEIVISENKIVDLQRELLEVRRSNMAYIEELRQLRSNLSVQRTDARVYVDTSRRVDPNNRQSTSGGSGGSGGFAKGGGILLHRKPLMNHVPKAIVERTRV